MPSKNRRIGKIMGNNENIKIEDEKAPLGKIVINCIKRILCLITPVACAFCGYFLSPLGWELLNQGESAPEYFKFICSVIFFVVPVVFIFIDSRKLNPIIKITITDKKD